MDIDAWHRAVVCATVGSYPDPTYIEVGVASGACWRAVHNGYVTRGKPSHGVDPAPAGLRVPIGAKLWQMPSDDFWPVYDGPPPDVVFIDGEHTADQARRDFHNAMKILAPDGAVLLHDVCPLEERYTVPQFCGDVYVLGNELRGDPNLRTFTFDRFPGVMLVQRAGGPHLPTP